MRAFTILQPCATAMLYGGKDWENRPNPVPTTIPIGEWIALHAGVRLWKDAALIRKLWPECPPDAELPMGALIGAWRLDGCVRREDLKSPGPWAFGPWCYRVGDVMALKKPLPCKGWQGWWTVPEKLATEVRNQITCHHLQTMSEEDLTVGIGQVLDNLKKRENP